MDGEPVNKVVAVIDLSRYSDICKELEQHLGTTAVASVNDLIRGLIHLALAGAGLSVDEVPYKGTGDGAIIILDSSKDASNFAENLHRGAEEHNRGKDVLLAQRHFRVGVYTGPVIIQSMKDRKKTVDFAGGVIGNAVRLEGEARTGEILIDAETWANLPPDLRRLYDPAETVKGKRDEHFHAHRRKVAERAPWDAEAATAAKPTTPSKNTPDSSDYSEVIKLHKRRLALLEQQAARHGRLTPPEIAMEIQDIKQLLSELNV